MQFLNPVKSLNGGAVLIRGDRFAWMLNQESEMKFSQERQWNHRGVIRLRGSVVGVRWYFR